MITFNMQTYGLLPVGTKRAPPPASVFNPDKLDTDAWVQAAKSFGAKYAVLTASHRSGFALWPTKSHNYSIAFSGQAGRDVLREFVASCRKFGLSPGVFWTQRFNDYFGVANNGVVDPARAVQSVPVFAGADLRPTRTAGPPGARLFPWRVLVLASALTARPRRSRSSDEQVAGSGDGGTAGLNVRSEPV